LLLVLGQPAKTAWLREREAVIQCARQAGLAVHESRDLSYWNEVDVVHLIGHGGFNTDRFGASDFLLTPTEKLRPIHLDSNPANGQTLVFLNSCLSGKTLHWGLNVKGWPVAFLRAGASVFLGPWCVVRDPHPVEFAAAFYGELFAGKTVGEALSWVVSASWRQRPSVLGYAAYYRANKRTS
jgi:CHAT domain-containing protein